MKRSLMAVCIMASCSLLFAQPGPGGPNGKPGRAGAKRGAAAPGMMAGQNGWAGARGLGGEMQTSGILRMLRANADITTDQATRISAIVDKAREDALAVLTPEQREKVEKLQARGAEMREKMQDNQGDMAERREEMQDRMAGRRQEMAQYSAVWRAALAVDLTAEQKTKVRELQKSTQEKMRATAQTDLKPEIEKIHKAAQDEVKALLTDDQKIKYDAKYEELKNVPVARGEGLGAKDGVRTDREKNREDRKANRPGGGRGPGAGQGPGAGAPPNPFQP